jgi:hypothetical protein
LVLVAGEGTGEDVLKGVAVRTVGADAPPGKEGHDPRERQGGEEV